MLAAQRPVHRDEGWPLTVLPETVVNRLEDELLLGPEPLLAAVQPIRRSSEFADHFVPAA
jgi:hypothetical protein